MIDGDEGFYLLASRLILQHKTPYLDFFYTQAPLLPYVYAAWLKIFGISWVSARLFCALLSAAIGALLYEHVCRETGEMLGGAVAVLLFATSSLVLAWYPIVKTFALAVLCLFAAYMVVARNSTSRYAWPAILAGTLAGLSIDTRSYIVIVVPIFILWIARYTVSHRLARSVYFLLGLLLGLIPSIAIFVQSPDNFFFNNLGYHALRSGDGLVGGWQNKAMVLLGVFGGSHTGFQFSLLTLVAVGLLLAAWKRNNLKSQTSNLLALWIAVAIGFVSLLPSPDSVQYFAIVIPFLIAAGVPAAADYIRALDPTHRRIAPPICAFLVAAFIAFGVPSFRQYMFTGYKVPGILYPADAPNWTLGEVSEVSKTIDHFAASGQEVASFWPGYIFASKADPYPGFENDFGLVVAPQLTPQKRQQYRILSYSDMVTEFASHGPRLVVIGNQGPVSGGPAAQPTERLLRSAGYTSIATIGHAVLFSYKGSPVADNWK